MNILYINTKTFKMLWVTLILIIPVFNSCEDFVEVDSPNNQLNGLMCLKMRILLTPPLLTYIVN